MKLLSSLVIFCFVCEAFSSDEFEELSSELKSNGAVPDQWEHFKTLEAKQPELAWEKLKLWFKNNGNIQHEKVPWGTFREFKEALLTEALEGPVEEKQIIKEAWREFEKVREEVRDMEEGEQQEVVWGKFKEFYSQVKEKGVGDGSEAVREKDQDEVEEAAKKGGVKEEEGEFEERGGVEEEGEVCEEKGEEMAVEEKDGEDTMEDKNLGEKGDLSEKVDPDKNEEQEELDNTVKPMYVKESLKETNEENGDDLMAAGDKDGVERSQLSNPEAEDNIESEGLEEHPQTEVSHGNHEGESDDIESSESDGPPGHLDDALKEEELSENDDPGTSGNSPDDSSQEENFESGDNEIPDVTEEEGDPTLQEANT